MTSIHNKFLIFMALFVCFQVKAEYYYSEVLNYKDGLPSGIIKDMVQDQQGMIWLASNIGLIKYDGSNYTIYNKDFITNKAISNSQIEKLYVDRNNNLYVGTMGAGINLFDRDSGKLKRLDYESNSISSISKDVNGNVWYSAYPDLKMLNETTGESRQYFINTQAKHITLIDNNTYFYADIKNNGGLYTLDRDQPKLLRKMNITFIHQDHFNKNVLWVGGSKGLFSFDVVNGLWQQLIKDVSFCCSVYRDQEHMWLRSHSKKLFLFNALTHKVEISSPLTQFGIPDESLERPLKLLLQDKSGVLWSSNSKELVKIQSDNVVDKITHELFKGSVIRTIKSDSEGNIWLGTWYKGLLKYDLSGKVTQFLPPKINKLNVTSLLVESPNKIWVGSRQGLFLLLVKDNEWRAVEVHHRGSIDYIQLMENGDILTTGIGLNQISQKDFSVTHFVENPINDNAILDDSIFSIVPLGNNQYLLSGATGICIYDADNQLFIQFSNKTHSKLAQSMKIDSLVDDENNLWINSGNQLEKITQPLNDDLKVESISTNQGLPYATYYSLIKDSMGYIWLGTEKGIYRYDPVNQKTINFSVGDGIGYGSIARYKAADLASDGSPLFATLDSIYKINLTKLNEYSLEAAKPIISGIQVNRNFVANKEKLELEYDENNLLIQFSLLDYRAPQKIRYAYQLQGFDEHWVQSGNVSEATYTNLSPGHYQFKLKSTNLNGVWGEEITGLNISISQPYWLTTWAYTIYAILLIIIIVLLVKVRTHKLEVQAQILKDKVNKKTSHIKNLLNRKNHFLSFVAHELRTPLTLIHGPINQVINKCDDSTSLNYLAIAQNNTQRLINLIDQLLSLSKYATLDKAKLIVVDVVELMRFIMACIQPYASEKKIIVNISDEVKALVKMLPQALDTILINLCMNAIKYSSSNSIIDIMITANKEYVNISVKDYGIGIDKEKLEIIFDAFYQVDQSTKGVGLGLAMIKEIVDAHEGEIKVLSELGKGSEFIVSLKRCYESSETYAQKRDGSNISIGNQIAKNESMLFDFAEESSNTKKYTVLIVDDNVEICQYINQILSKHFYCSWMLNGNEAIAFAQQESPDLILCDVMMPEMDGIEFVKIIRENISTSHIPVILITANSNDDVRLGAYEQHADDFIQKPFNSKELILRIKNMLEIRSIANQATTRKMLIEDSPSADKTFSKEELFLFKFKKMIDSYYTDSNFDLNQMLKIMCMSARPLQKKVKFLLGISPTKYLRIYRIEKAKEYLATGELTTQEILKLVGIKNRSHFHSYFKAHTGVTPSEYHKINSSKEKVSIS